MTWLQVQAILTDYYLPGVKTSANAAFDDFQQVSLDEKTG